MTGPEFFYLFEYIKCESFKDHKSPKKKNLRGIQSRKISRNCKFPKIPKKHSIGTSINVLCRTRISNSLRILQLSVFTLEGHFRCSHHFVTFCSQRVTIFHVTILTMSPNFSTGHHLRYKQCYRLKIEFRSRLMNFNFEPLCCKNSTATLLLSKKYVIFFMFHGRK